MQSPRVAIIGAGMAGLTAAIDLARSGCAVTVFERAATPGGKLRELPIGPARLDAGPTVFTMRRVFDELFADAGDRLDARLRLTPATLLARHAWSADQQLDLFADLARSTETIGAFAGAAEARAFVRFAAHAKRIFETLDGTFMRSTRPSPVELVRRVGIAGLPDLWNIKPFDTLWQSVSRYFTDPRLRQLFGRYATYCGSSPFACPATLMLVSHVEQSGVWYVEGGMHRLVEQLVALASRLGVNLRYGAHVREIHVQGGRVNAVETADERVSVDAVVCNADNNALATGLFGGAAARAVARSPEASRSLSAITWNLLARTSGFELAHHSVFFSDDYRAEFEDIFSHRRVPSAPTIYICAMDREDERGPGANKSERLFCLINAPAVGDSWNFNRAEIDACTNRVFETLRSCGLLIEPKDGTIVTTPEDFHRLFPATGGALYGPASHGWRASFARPGSRSTLPGLYLAGGSTHPGPGIPMAALSGRLAAASLMTDYASISRSHPVAMSGGTSTR